MTDYEGVDVQKRRPHQPRCTAPRCQRPQARNAEGHIKEIPLCWKHISVAHGIEEEARRQERINRYTTAAKEAGKDPEEMFWAPDIFPSQRATELMRQHQDKRDLDEYRALIASGKIKGRPAPKPEKSEQDGVVYYLRVGSYIKIGWSLDLGKRMRSYPPDSVLLATEPGTRKDEARRHKMFAVHRTHGREWYAMVPSLMHHIEQIAAKHGTPDPVTFAAKPVEIPQPRDARPIMPRGWSGHATVAS